MKTNDMLPLIEREVELLTDDNWHAAATIMREAGERIRILAQRLREAGLSAEAE